LIFAPHISAMPLAQRATLLFALLLVSSLWTPATFPQSTPAERGEARASRAFELARKRGSPALEAFFYSMPKGADLHSHLTGAIYAETWIHEAAEDHLCIRVKTLSFYKTMAMTRSLPPQPVCGEEGVPASSAFTNQHLYDSLIDAMSMRNFVPTATESGHDHFFGAFEHFEAVDAVHLGEWLDEVATRAAAQNEQYLELMQTPDLKTMAALSAEAGPVNMQTSFRELREQLLDKGLRGEIPAARAQFDEGEASRQSLEHCKSAQSTPGCQVEVRYIYQVLRALPPEMVFAQLVTGFELASADPLVVGVNLVQPEDNYVAMADYRLHMKMIDALHKLYPKVHISLHAGELAPQMVPPEGLTFHIRSAVEEGHAERIGHGVDLAYEDDPYGLLKEMAARRVMVEINLTSNDVILNIK
jgi:adenosine deaminase